MSFISTTRIYTKRARWSDWPLYFFDLLFIAAAWLAYDSIDFLRSFGAGTALIVGSPYGASVLGGLGIGGVRLSMYIAIIRKNRTPQRLEWITCLGGIAFMFTFILFGGLFLNLLAGFEGYKRCATEQTRDDYAVFARAGTPCPAHWKGPDIDE